MMGSMLGDLPSFDPHNFSQLRPSDPSNPSKVVPTTYCPTHSRTSPPPDQGSNHNKLVLKSIIRNQLVLFFVIAFGNASITKSFGVRMSLKIDEKFNLRPKRAATEHPTPEHGCKQPRASTT
ncbi:hypothetical protein GOBAR_AA19144 [Gossypium barbadense]|uniref:DET1- and DDB1-associated protein 1 domain-containing protein n=1 Tax=Gossypium barbadense TaxID=3634 RepID=A0A2P5XDZ4_GOSBA|nr:hypothetical protein GOBAR_AA19144 [Gossypium barbadense]